MLNSDRPNPEKFAHKLWQKPKMFQHIERKTLFDTGTWNFSIARKFILREREIYDWQIEFENWATFLNSIVWYWGYRRAENIE